MSTDLSRSSFRPLRHFQDVRLQQGRLVTDADVNEQADILNHLRRRSLRDIIGATGAPKDSDGFRIEWLNDGVVQDLAIHPGTYYVDGLLCELEAELQPVRAFLGPQDLLMETAQADGRAFSAGQWLRIGDGTTERTLRLAALAGTTLSLATDEDLQVLFGGAAVMLQRLTTYTTQPDFPLAENGADDLTTILAGAPNAVVAYLDVWDRPVTGAEDPELLDEALGGADTTTRTQRVWQLRLASDDASVCDLLHANWQPSPAVRHGRLRARAEAGGISNDPCITPAQGGFRRLENQLYRVEVFSGGGPGSATFVWSRDNASRIARIDEINGQTLRVRSPGRDVLEGLPATWVEITDRRRILRGEPGHLARVSGVQGDILTLILPVPSGLFDPASHTTLMRRWDSDGALPLTDGDFLDLESGVQVEFDGESFSTGDHWLIPARAASGRVLWPSEGSEVLFQPRQGTQHVFAPLAFVADPAHAASLEDCRVPFPSLTELEASDIGFDDSTCSLGGVTTVQEAIEALCTGRQECCTITLRPSPGWFLPLQAIKPGANLHLCFQAGDFPVPSPLLLKGLGDVKVSGSGPATRLIAANGETVLRFESCATVMVRDLYAEGRQPEPVSTSRLHNRLHGPLTFWGCGSVVLENVKAKCPFGVGRAASCITIDGSIPTEDADAHVRTTASVRVLHCDLRMGHDQVGLLILNATRVQVEDNVIRVASKPRGVGMPQLFQNKKYRADFRRRMLRRGRIANPGELDGEIPEDRVVFQVRSGNRMLSVTFETDPALQAAWNDYQAWQRLRGVQSEHDLYRHLRNVANRVLANRGELQVGSRTFTGFSSFYNSLLSVNPAIAAQGLVVSGSTGGVDVRVVNNTVIGARQGIHLVLGRGDDGNPLNFGTVRVRGNTVRVFQNPSFTRGGGIHVGSCSSLLIEDNHVEVRRSGSTTAIEVAGLSVRGQLGRRCILRHNHTRGAGPSIQAHALTPGSNSRGVRIIRENAIEAVTPALAVPIRTSGVPFHLSDNV